jgi:hypothetical protein
MDVFSSESSAAGGTKDFVRKILSDTQVKKRPVEIYPCYHDNRIISEEILLHIADSYARLPEQSQDRKKQDLFQRQKHLPNR